MMVIFVSQCEKKALNKTRRVLDAFANRIGDNTWQTVITNDGLIAVKNLLRRTASKNSAITCHWIRSRSRSDLLWLVGSTQKFNHYGIVPVNVTKKELFMDIASDKPKAGVLYANTHLQTLPEHLFAVGYVAEKLHQKLIPHRGAQHDAVIFAGGCLHDVGKIDPCFQDWVKNPKSKVIVVEDGQHVDKGKFSFDKHPRHNEISLLLYQLLDDTKLEFINQANKRTIKHVIYWHHAKPFRKDKNSFESYRDILSKLDKNIGTGSITDLVEGSIKLLSQVTGIDKKYRATDESILSKCVAVTISQGQIESIEDAPNLPSYKNYDVKDRTRDYQKLVSINANNNIARSCVITADRLISSLSASELHSQIQDRTLHELIDNTLLAETSLKTHIESCLANFPQDKRSIKQNEKAIELSRSPAVAVLSGAAGCGKTKIALEWAKIKEAQKIIWICPRVQICQGLFNDLTSEQYLKEANIEINTGEFKFINEWGVTIKDDAYFSGDIVITTIDQIFSAITSHTKANLLVDFLNSHIVFDEYHEYINMPAFNLLFAELVACKQAQENIANTLLVSATPHYFYVEELLGLDREDIISMPSFNKSGYQIDRRVFDEATCDQTNPLYTKQQGKTFVISNTAITAQQSFIQNQANENAVLIHSKFKKSDKLAWFNEVYESFQNQGTEKFEVLRSGPIVQAALNISCNYMVSEVTSAENFLQRLGRLDRFGTNTEINTYCIAVPEPIDQGKGTGKSARFLARMFSFGSAKAWDQLVQSELGNRPFSLNEIYKVYEQFHSSEGCKALIESDLLSALKESVNQINLKVIDPITLSTKKPAKGRAKISKASLRGNNRFIQLAVCDVTDHKNIKFLNNYAYELPIDERSEIDNLTASCNEIEGYGDSDKNLLSHMKKKHHQIMGGTKAFKDFILLNEARTPELPVYLSYTSSDLDQVGGNVARHSEAIYYAVCDKQPIGAISIQKLTNKSE